MTLEDALITGSIWQKRKNPNPFGDIYAVSFDGQVVVYQNIGDDHAELQMPITEFLATYYFPFHVKQKWQIPRSTEDEATLHDNTNILRLT